jgi:cell division protein FtsI (penicillin-binding protein 3)
MGNHASVTRRLSLFAILLVLLVAALSIRLVDFQIVRADEIRSESLESRKETRTLTALRGSILDANGEVLARTVFRYDINAAPKNVGPVIRYQDGNRSEISVETAAQELARVLGLSTDEVLAKISGDSAYSNLAKKVDATVYNQIRELDIPWIYWDRFAYRLYPNGAVAGNVLGFVSSDGTPLAGLERQYNSCLAGVDGQETYERSAEGVRIPTSNVVTQPTQDGGSLNLSIDANLQFFAQQVLAKSVADLDAQWASAIVIEAKTGRILAAAEAPTVDPNDPGASEAADRGSRIMQFAFEPGSVMKAISTAMVLDSKSATIYETVNAPDRLKLKYEEYIKDSFSHETYQLTLAGVLRYSSNTGIYSFGMKIDEKTRFNYLQKFGFGKTTDLNFEGESSGILRPYDEWQYSDRYTHLFGQGVAVTPLQMAFAYQAIANEGVRLSPSLVDSCVNSEGEVVYSPERNSTRVISKESANMNLQLMEKVVQYGGVGRLAGIPGYRVAGKTGTAEIREGAGYGERFAISFFGIAPVEDPRFIVGVTIYKPVGETNSVKATGPFKAIMQQALKHYRVPPSTSEPRDDIPSNRYGKTGE